MGSIQGKLLYTLTFKYLESKCLTVNIPTIRIGKAYPEDAAEILKIQKLAFHSEAELVNNFNIPPLTQSLESLQKDFSSYSIFKVVSDNMIIGAAKSRVRENGNIEICRVVVHPTYQGKGIGKCIMVFIEQSYPERTEFELFTAEKSTHNIKFYEKLGYSISERFTEPGHADIVLVKMTKKKLASK